MCEHEQKRCPRCQALFECQSGSTPLCQCQTVYLTPEHLDYVGERYADCLCASSLRAMPAEHDIVQWTAQFNASSGNEWR